jgi:hypothetical protein
MGERRVSYKVLMGRPGVGGKRSHGKLRRRWEGNNKMCLQEITCREWTDLPQGRDNWWAFVDTVMEVCVPYNAGRYLTTCGNVRFSEQTPWHALSDSFVSMFLVLST